MHSSVARGSMKEPDCSKNYLQGGPCIGPCASPSSSKSTRSAILLARLTTPLMPGSLTCILLAQDFG